MKYTNIFSLICFRAELTNVRIFPWNFVNVLLVDYHIASRVTHVFAAIHVAFEFLDFFMNSFNMNAEVFFCSETLVTLWAENMVWFFLWLAYKELSSGWLFVSNFNAIIIRIFVCAVFLFNFILDTNYFNWF